VSLSHRISWLGFAVSCLAAASFAAFGWMVGWYQNGQLALLVVTVAFAAWVVAGSSRKGFAFSVAALAVAGANWRLLEGAAMVATWSVQGFAP
jgi:hypothetical protein